MSDSRRLVEDPYAEDDYPGIRPPQPKLRQQHHQSGGPRVRHRSRTPPRRKERGGRSGEGNADEWDRHQDVMRQRLREKQEQSRRAHEMFREEIRRQSSALRGQRPQSMLQMPQGLSSVAMATGSGSDKRRSSSREQTRDRSSSPSRHHHHRGKKAASQLPPPSVAMVQEPGQEQRRKRSKRHHRGDSTGISPPTRGRSRSPIRPRIQSAAVHPATQQPGPAKGMRGSGHGSRPGSRRREGRRRRRQKNGRRRASSSSHSSTRSVSSRSSSVEEGGVEERGRGRGSRARVEDEEKRQRRRRKRRSMEEEMAEDIALLSEPDVGIGEEEEEVEEEMEEGEAGSDVVSDSPDHGDREEGEHEDQDDEEEGEEGEEEEEEEEEEEVRRRSPSSRYYYPGRSKFDSASSSGSSSRSDSEDRRGRRRRSSDEEEGEDGVDDGGYSDEERRPVGRRHKPVTALTQPQGESEHSSSSEDERHPGQMSNNAGRSTSSSAEEDEEEEEEEEEDEEEEDEDDVRETGGVSGGVSSSGGGGGTPAQGSGAQEEQERQLRLEHELRRRAKPWYLPSVLGCRSVEEFMCLNRIEEGTYGVVYRARDKKTGEVVALKRLKMEKEREGFPITSLREINTLLKAQHPNIVTVREIVVGSNMDKIYIVMGYVEHDLKSLMEVMKEPFMIGEVKTLMMQLLSAVAHLHDNWILHRDLKTSNLLLSHKGILKVGDFGLAREYGSPLRRYTPVVVTLWYRAVELLLGCKLYSTAVDMWSVGCIFAELLLMKPLFPGKGEANQLNLIFRELGTPNERIWPGFSELPLAKKLTLEPVYQFNSLRKRFPDNILSELGFDLMNKLLTYCPERRINADDALKHAYFTEKPHPIPPHLFPTWPAKSEGAAVHHKKKDSPTPPSGGLAYSKIVASSEKEVLPGLGFRLTGDIASKTGSGTDQGFRLKF